ncbi:MAG: sugar phosphate isomerase/epimerase [Candidatus Latescibacteria bacterium]|nr:sugar phosphate isomerase/epimerase [Candidatus Latescibacterota bacterium]
MEIGINLEYVRHKDKSFEYGVETAAKMGYQWIEPCFLMGRCLLSNAGYCHVRSMDIDPQWMKDFCDQHGVKISGLSAHSDLLNTEWGVAYAKRACAYAKAVGAPVVQICEDMYAPQTMTKDEVFAIMKINLKSILPTYEANGIYLGVEQHGPYTARTETILRILDLVDSPMLKVNYDCGNTYLAGTDPYEMLDAVADRVVHVHAKDISIEHSEAERGKVTGTPVGCACGDGVIDWERIITRLKEVNYSGVFSVECGTEEQAVRSLSYLNGLLARM